MTIKVLENLHCSEKFRKAVRPGLLSAQAESRPESIRGGAKSKPLKGQMTLWLEENNQNALPFKREAFWFL
ncbi:MAG: hypothetical protein A2942_03950 [Candidatus Lloydbacteria bacterium RIFCSPLOWO2_01_FULL_50_20]|uniref:Uncharacterized protein n=1 Tax=Candidatus Lloydbacteria bacterium RIFCSPLOWO2_01_FULL_50_20 TaxID=1798665 RepID=A0A1G2DHV8_9BACT|nr:MAG: hypothetical protein A2942_03950 [Candidatus Lloydbacteria bacterium RIFCSPLOWO2_01_FULL_50_20]